MRRGGRAIPALLLRLLLLRLILLLLIRLMLGRLLLLLIILLLLMLLVTMVLLRLLLLVLVLLLLIEVERGGIAMTGLHRRRLCGRTHGEIERALLRRRYGVNVRHIGLKTGDDATRMQTK